MVMWGWRSPGRGADPVLDVRGEHRGHPHREGRPDREWRLRWLVGVAAPTSAATSSATSGAPALVTHDTPGAMVLTDELGTST